MCSHCALAATPPLPQPCLTLGGPALSASPARSCTGINVRLAGALRQFAEMAAMRFSGSAIMLKCKRRFEAVLQNTDALQWGRTPAATAWAVAAVLPLGPHTFFSSQPCCRTFHPVCHRVPEDQGPGHRQTPRRATGCCPSYACQKFRRKLSSGPRFLLLSPPRCRLMSSVCT